jgi:hypothetical protein
LECGVARLQDPGDQTRSNQIKRVEGRPSPIVAAVLRQLVGREMLRRSESCGGATSRQCPMPGSACCHSSRNCGIKMSKNLYGSPLSWIAASTYPEIAGDRKGGCESDRIKVNQSDQSKLDRIWLTQRREGRRGFHVGATVFKVNQTKGAG